MLINILFQQLRKCDIYIPYNCRQYSQMMNTEPTCVNHMFFHAERYQGSLFPRWNNSVSYLDESEEEIQIHNLLWLFPHAKEIKYTGCLF